jgi:lysozyme
MARQVTGLGLQKLKEWEGLVLYAYDDADRTFPRRKIMAGDKVAGTLTIGYGRTKGVKPGMTCTEAQAEMWLLEELATFSADVERLVTVPLNDNQFAALVAFHFNTGALGKSTLLKELNKGNYGAVPTEMMRWVKTTINGQRVESQGLKNRRAAEIGLWSAGSFVVSAAVPVAPIRPPIITKESATIAATSVATVGTVAFQGTGPVQWAIAAAVVIATAGVTVLLLKRHL